MNDKPLDYELMARVREWIEREAPRVRQEGDYAKLTITLAAPELNRDKALTLEATFEEEFAYEAVRGAVSGVK